MATAFKSNDTVRVKSSFLGAGKVGTVRIVDDKPVGRPPRVKSGVLVEFAAEGTSTWFAPDQLEKVG